ncbi:MAG: hypothetical protein ACRDWX_05310, partial [Acidimicrobiia bacterium]
MNRRVVGAILLTLLALAVLVAVGYGAYQAGWERGLTATDPEAVRPHLVRSSPRRDARICCSSRENVVRRQVRCCLRDPQPGRDTQEVEGPLLEGG